MIGNTSRKLVLTGAAGLAPCLAPAQQLLNQPTYDPVAMAAAEGLTYQTGMAMIALIVIIIAALIFATVRERHKQALLMSFAEKGQEIPSSLLPQPPSPEREMRRGVWILAGGLGLGLALYTFTGDWTVAAWSLIPIFLGAASFVNAALFYPKANSSA